MSKDGAQHLRRDFSLRRLGLHAVCERVHGTHGQKGGSRGPHAPRAQDSRAREMMETNPRLTWGGLAYESQPFAKKVASALALFAPLGTKLAHSARVRTIKHRLERWKPLSEVK